MSAFDRLKAAFAEIVRFVMRDTRYHQMYPCEVQGQSADATTLDLLPDDEEIRGTGLSGVPLRHGLPGITVRVPRGARVRLGFAAGDPTRPYAALWEPGTIESISFDGGTKPIARVGDSVTCFWPPSVPFIGTLAGMPFTGTMTITSPAPGIIGSGNPDVTA